MVNVIGRRAVGRFSLQLNFIVIIGLPLGYILITGWISVHLLASVHILLDAISI
jgi:hypothetical protein